MAIADHKSTGCAAPLILHRTAQQPLLQDELGTAEVRKDMLRG